MLLKFCCDAWEAVLNRYLALDDELFPKLNRLSGKVIKIDLIGLPIHYFLKVGMNHLYVLDEYTGSVDAEIKGTPAALFFMWQQQKLGKFKFSNDIEIKGNIDVSQEFNAIMQSVEVDWEEQFAKVFGDVIAHNVSNFCQDGSEWLKKNIKTFNSNLSEYLQEEARHLPTKLELEDYYMDVDRLRHDFDRVNARFERILKTLKK